MNNRSPRILITRLSAVGDCVHTMPLVGALRQEFPTAYLAWAIQPGAATLLDGYPGLDRVIITPRNWLKSIAQIRSMRRQLQAERFDIAIDPQSLSKSSLLGWLSGAKRRIGFAAPQGRELSLVLNNIRVRTNRDHVVDRYLQLMEPLTGMPVPQPATFELPAWSFPEIDAFLKQSMLKPDYCILNPGAGWDSKLWLPERFAATAHYLYDVHRMHSVVVWAGDRERRWAELIVDGSGGAAVLAPKTTLQQLAQILRRAALCVAADTGPLHLAVAVGTPCVGLYGTTRPQICGPYGAPHRAVQAYYQAGTSRQRRSASNTAMQAIDVTMVGKACSRVLTDASRLRAA